MKSCQLGCLLLLFIALHRDSVSGLCKLTKPTVAECGDIDDARDIETYNLQVLRARTSAKTLNSEHFKNLSSLQQLDLSGGNLEDVENGSFVMFPNLHILDLADNKIKLLEVGAFDGLKHLHSLMLSNNNITQLPPALMSLKELKRLELSGNPLICNCATLKLRDLLISRGVKITKKAVCAGPEAVKTASIMKPDTKKTCEFEKQDLEMQGDEPPIKSEDGSGETKEPDVLNEEYDDKELASEEDDTLTTVPLTSSESSLSVSSESISTDALSSTTEGSSENAEGSAEDITTLPPLSSSSSHSPESSSAEVSTEKSDASSVLVEGSGEEDDDGSGEDSSGMIANVPPIDFSDSIKPDLDENHDSADNSSTSTTESSLWSTWGLSGLINQINPFATSEGTTETPITTAKSIVDEVKEEEFIPVQKTIDKKVSPPIKMTVSDDVTSRHIAGSGEESEQKSVNEIEDNSINTAFSQETKQGMSPYLMLMSFLVILAVLIGYMAYRGDFCRKNRKRSDVERGTELKDMQKSLLDHNSSNQPKVTVANGNTMENVPLMNSTNLPDEPKENQKSYDVTTNGSSRLNGTTIEINDPVKPPRKSTNSGEIEAPLNGLHPPMEDIDGPTRTSWINGSNEVINREDPEDDYSSSPNAQKVKITLQEIPDSVPKTPMLITRLQDGENLVKTP